MSQEVKNEENAGKENTAEWYVYIVRCRNGALYTGITTDLTRRIEQHNQGKGAKYTRANGPVELVYSEVSQGHTEALRREREVKKFSRGKKLELVHLSRKGNCHSERT